MKAVFLALFLVGCVTYETPLVNAKGEERYCGATGHGLIGVKMADVHYTNCINEAGKDGFKPK